MESDYDTKELLLSNSKHTISAKNIVLPPTPPVAKIRSLKHQHRLSGDRLTSSSTHLDSSIENTSVHLGAPRGRRDSTDSGLASGGANKSRSADSEMLSRHYLGTESGHSSPEDDVISAKNKKITQYSSSRQLEQFVPRDEASLPKYSGNTLPKNRKPSSEKYFSTASDRAADIEVSSIMRVPPEQEQSWRPTDSSTECGRNPNNTTSIYKRDAPQMDHPRRTERSPALNRKVDVASLLRHNKLHDARLSEEKCASADESNPRHFRGGNLSDSECVDDAYESGYLRQGRKANKAEEYDHLRLIRSSSRNNIDSQNGYSEVQFPGISSSDTRRSSSIRYEPVQTDHPYNPPSPGPHLHRRNLSRSSHYLEEAGSEAESTPNDLTLREEEQMPLTCREHESSASSELTTQHQLRGPSYVSRTHADRLYKPKPTVAGTAYKDQRHHTGQPRMGTGFVPAQNSRSSNYLPTSSLQTQQSSSAIAAHIAPATTPEGDFSVVTTALKLSHEEDESGMWSYRGGNEPDRSQFANYPGNALPSRNTSGDPENSTASRFMNQPSILIARTPHFESGLPRRSVETRAYNHSGTLKSLKSRCWGLCSWKSAAIFFLILSILLLLAFAVVFIVNPFASNAPSVNDPDSTECLVSTDPSTSTALVTIETPSTELQILRTSAFTLSPSTFKWMQIYIEEPSHIKFNFTVGASAQFAVYGRKGLRPSHTKFDFFEKIDGNLLPTTSTSFIALTTTTNHRSRKKRSLSSGAKVQTEFLEYLDAGTWHLAVFNDRDEADSFQLTTSISEGLTQCPNSCSNNGDCEKGICKCFHGFQGNDCSQVSCAVTCRGNGVYAEGKCVCFFGWKGLDCGTPSNYCLDPECGGHGRCSPDGECICENGFKGESCSEVDCYDPSCSDHGVCVDGECRCDRGWMGKFCSEKDLVCLSACGGHGTFDAFTKSCICDPGWSGTDCSTATCRPTCESEHGYCVDGRCRCNSGWTGAACDQRQCDARCEEHGQCVRGMCMCDAGWNGNLCTFAGCLNDCSGNGDCALDMNGDWYCTCRSGWKGPGCSIKVEVLCGDGKDNDLDTLIDCQDPDCCSHRSCSRTSQCRGGLDPTHEIASSHGRSSTLPTASFYDRVKFLIHRNGVQANADSSVFEPRRASVVRGQVLTSDGSPLVGVNVQVQDQPKYGSSKTRVDGWYDLMVNGGGSLVLKFQRPSFLAATSHVFVPWNKFVVASSVTLRSPREPASVPRGLDGGKTCNPSLLSPPSSSILVTSVRAYTAAECAEKGSVIPEIQAVREAVTLPGSKAALVYLSSRSEGYKSIIEISLINGEKPLTLREITVQVTVQGKQYDQKFEPLSDLIYTFEWNREDAYGQRVYGSVSAEVLVGYLYNNCPDILWKKMETTLQGHNPTLETSIASWSLDIHHTYHPDKGVVYLGGGGEMRLLEQPPVISTVIGDGQPRHIICDRCDGPASTSRLMSPVALASDAHGNIYIGDHDFIRKLDTTGNVSSLFSTSSPPTKYHMAVSPVNNGLLYFSDPVQKKIFRLRRMSMPRNRPSRDLTANVELVAGSGASCYPLQKDACGDDGPATAASLTSPKGLAIDASGRLYFVDGTRIRVVNPSDGNIMTFTGSLLSTGTRPLQCSGSMSVDQLELNYPTDLAINPRDGSLFVLDQEIVIKIDLKTRHALLVAGVPPHCARKVAKYPDDRDARKVPLISPTSISVSVADGSLYIAETDQSFINRIRRVDPYNGRIATVAGIDSSCDCATQQCQCFGGDGDFARSASLHNPISITVTPDGIVYVADQLNLRIRKIWHSLSEKKSNRYQVSDPDRNQLYIFDANGRHLLTNNVITNTPLYRFSYAANGLLSSATDVSENSLSISYTIARRPRQITLPSGDIISLAVGQGQALTKLSQGSSTVASFTYHDDNTGLIRSSIRGRFASTFYVYNAHGRLVTVTSLSGAMTSLYARSNATSQTVTMKTIATSAGDENESRIGVGRRDVIITTEPGYLCDIITTVEGAMRTVYKRWTDNSISVHYLDNSELIFETKPHPVLGLTTPSLAKRTIQLPADPLENKIEWKTRKENENGYSPGQVLLGRRMRVNDRNILSLDFSQGQMMEKIYDDHTKFMLRVQYNDRGLPYLWMPNGGISPVNVTYDAKGHAITWQRGGESEAVAYDRNGNPQRSRLADGSVWRYKYSDKVSSVVLPDSTLQYDFGYDENNNLERVTLPSGLSYNINKMYGVGFIRTTISGPDGVTSFIQDENDFGNVLSTTYPGELRKVLYRYDVHGHVTEILHDAKMTKMLRDSQSGELVSLATDDCTLRYHRNGPLVQRHVITSTTNAGLLATFDYSYDINLRLSSVKVKVNGSRLPVENLTYNDVSGKLTTFGTYRIIDMSSNVYAIGNERFTLSKQFDNSGRLTATRVEVYGITLFRMSIEYDLGGRVSRQEIDFVLSNNMSSFNYRYSQLGSLVRVDQNDQTRWSYAYDNDGGLVRSDDKRSRTTLRYDSKGRLASMGDVQFTYDRDGFLQQRGHDAFEYDSMGRLVKAYRIGKYEITYGYDGLGRLATRVDVKRKSVMRYLYANIQQPELLTHVYNVASGVITTFRYDVEGYLFAIDLSNGTTWSVVCDHIGSPIAVMDTTTVIKALKYSPFGQVIFDSNPRSNLHIGFRGGIYDIDTELVHFYDRSALAPLFRPDISSAKPLGLSISSKETSTKIFEGIDYDPLTGQITSSGIKSLSKFDVTSLPLRLHQVNDPVNFHPTFNHMTDTKSWLGALGFKLQNVAPDPHIASRQKDKSSAECQLSRHLSSYMNMQTATPSVLVPESHANNAPGGAMLAQGLVISIDRGQVSTQVTDTATDDVKRFSSVVSGAEVLIGRNADSPLAPMSLRHEGKPVLYLTKPASAFAKDKQTMQIPNDRQKTLRSANGHGVDVTSSLISLRLHGNEMRAESGYGLVVIFYVDDGSDVRIYDVEFTSTEQERTRVLESAKDAAETEAWLLEKRKIHSGLKTRWTRAQQQEILSQGRLLGYTVRQIWNPKVYPEFSDSGRNVEFIPKT